MKILFTGGGTSGHVMPIIAIARELKNLYQGNDLILDYIGPKDEYSLLLSRENLKLHTIISGKIRRYFSFQNILDVLFKIPIGFIQSFFLLLFIRPNLVFSKGGSASVVVCMSARIMRIPVFLHESDSAAGLSNKKVSKFAKKIFISFEETEGFEAAKTVLTGNPIRNALLLEESSQEVPKEVSELTMEKPIILVIGGSQGAEAINEFIILILNDLLEKYEIIHVAGVKNFSRATIQSQLTLNKYLEKYYHLYPSLDETRLKHFYKVTDFIISRAGSGSIFEIASLGKPSILIPLPQAASDHQLKNAYQYSKTGAALVIEQKNLTPNFFWGELNYLLSQPEVLERMKNSALAFSKPQAAQMIAEEILRYLIK